MTIQMMATEGILKFTLASVHCALWLKDRIGASFLWLWMVVLQLTINKYKGKKLEDILSDVKKLDKIPSHLAVLVHQEPVSCDDLARVAVWAFASGIRIVSFYDPNGKILELKTALQSRISHHHKQIFSPPLPDFRVSTAKEPIYAAKFSAEVYHDSGIFHVVLLSPEDGRQRLAEVAAEVCEAVVRRREQLEQISVDILASRITGAVGIPDPEVVLIFGSTCSMMGYPPWHLRLSEIHTLPSHHKAQYKDFYSVLQKYSSCKQRLGK